MLLQEYLKALEKDEQNLKDYLSTGIQDHRFYKPMEDANAGDSSAL